MPGLSIVYRLPGAPMPPRERWDDALAAARGDGGSRGATLLDDGRCRIGSEGHDRYPVASLVEDGLAVVLEGRIYSGATRQPLDALRALADELAGGADEAAAIRRRVAAWEGDFLAVIYARAERRLWVFGDALGRLPLYAVAGDDGLAVSRDQRFLLAHEGARDPDRLGIAQLLLLGFPLGTRTLARGIERVAAGRGFRADASGVVAREGLEEPFDFGDKARAGVSDERNAEDLAERFLAACRIRAGAGDPPLLALSGGLDSRAVGAALARTGHAFDSFTLCDDARTYAHEIPVARTLAATLGAPWRLFQAPPPTAAVLDRMLEMKTGLNSLAMGYSLPIFAMLHDAYGAGHDYWTGDGGDKLLPDHRPGLSARGRADLAGYLIHGRPIWAAPEVARLTGVSEEALRASLESELARFPERDPDQRFVRFQFAERGARWIFEGEDCNRHAYWTVAPFYDREFLRAAVACPDDQKSGHRLYRRFLRRLHPGINRVPDANLGIAMDAPGYVWARRLRELGRRFPRLRGWLRLGAPASVLPPAPALFGAILTRQLERSGAVRDCFSAAALAGIAASPRARSGVALDALLTATCAVERITEGASSLRGFASETFAGGRGRDGGSAGWVGPGVVPGVRPAPGEEAGVAGAPPGSRRAVRSGIEPVPRAE